MPWRDNPSFYNVLVSELMLQQTQVARVIPKFTAFMQQFPSIQALAAAPLASVLVAWQGLGYNRRAKYLHQAAQHVVQHGQPRTVADMEQLPGVGANTAAAIMNYVYNVPVPFVETNIRTVMFNHFFAGKADVTDTAVRQKVLETLPAENPREWFWALMDYGTYLKTRAPKNNMSRHYKKQSPLQGSVRQVRGQIVTALSTSALSATALRTAVAADERFSVALRGLLADGLITKTGRMYHLTK